LKHNRFHHYGRLTPSRQTVEITVVRSTLTLVFESIEDLVARNSALIGSPEQIIDEAGRYHEQLGHEVMHLSADAGVTASQQRRSLELFQSDVAPALRERIPSRPLISQSTPEVSLTRVASAS
jgi:alkanesulfonate monooxygenase SsuD/methylene tetrahydromethanopterin reductase-like flavin-dependent oxidoreductase (luciferase family)